ncbi:type II CRISPR-associated endonuclease Cas1 [Kangiella shandongensis]|uniref:type II CRISPR-associated endonuclease Cas1 n=1 Tax=Kangiella shandongensis TaxID=2763258 RepID=UPI001CBB2939|nr:type II CRISPR-associated endonuclease Cas1 [Kangiella shandongensis]
MRWNVLEIAQNGRYLKLYRGFLLVMDDKEELGRVIIDELNCLVLSAEQATLSKQIIVKLAEHGIPIITCGTNYHPISITLPYSVHHQSNKVIHLQIDASQPLKKRLWQRLVKAKIFNQYRVLDYCDPAQSAETLRLKRLSNKVRSGDPDNCEAQASRIYWQSLMGSDFRRRPRSSDVENSALNYGYTILRAACARAIVAAGLNPSLGLHHQNINNPFCLADDLMEIYRPLIDLTIQTMDLVDTLTPSNKAALTKVLQADVTLNEETTTVNTSMQKLAQSVVQSLDNKEVSLQIPELVI